MTVSAGPSDAPLVPPDDLVEVARVLGAHGIRGALKIETFGPAADSVLRQAKPWWIIGLPPSTANGRAGGPTSATPTSVRVQMDALVAQIDGLDDRDEAARWRGARLAVPRSVFPPPGNDEYYHVDLIGCEVRDLAGGLLGTVSGVEEFGAGPLLEVQGPDGVSRLIPFVKATVPTVDLPARLIVADWGLDY